jgi:hypothetical protein
VDLLADNLDWSRSIARAVHRSLPPAFDLEDLNQAAAVALWRAVGAKMPLEGSTSGRTRSGRSGAPA